MPRHRLNYVRTSHENWEEQRSRSPGLARGFLGATLTCMTSGRSRQTPGCWRPARPLIPVSRRCDRRYHTAAAARRMDYLTNTACFYTDIRLTGLVMRGEGEGVGEGMRRDTTLFYQRCNSALQGSVVPLPPPPPPTPPLPPPPENHVLHHRRLLLTCIQTSGLFPPPLRQASCALDHFLPGWCQPLFKCWEQFNEDKGDKCISGAVRTLIH